MHLKRFLAPCLCIVFLERLLQIMQGKLEMLAGDAGDAGWRCWRCWLVMPDGGWPVQIEGLEIVSCPYLVFPQLRLKCLGVTRATDCFRVLPAPRFPVFFFNILAGLQILRNQQEIQPFFCIRNLCSWTLQTRVQREMGSRVSFWGWVSKRTKRKTTHLEGPPILTHFVVAPIFPKKESRTQLIWT